MINNFDFQTPCHIFDLEQLEKNINTLLILQNETQSKVLYAIKGCSQRELLPYISKYLSGACTSGYNEVLLADISQFKEIHTFSAAYKENEIQTIAQKSFAVIFNSIEQFKKYSPIVYNNKAIPSIRITPQYSEIKNNKINPCSKNSRFGVGINELEQLDTIPQYLHFHSMCEQYSDTLTRTLEIVGHTYEKYLKQAQTINIGGGQLYTAENYDLNQTIKSINKFKSQYNLSVILEPGEAVLYNVGYLVGSVIDIKCGEKSTAILDLSAICHMPDIVFSGYKYKVVNGYESNSKNYSYILAGPTCYSGDIFGEFSFDEPLTVGSKIIFCDTAHYTTVKGSMFNGISLPSIALHSKEYLFKNVRIYGFDDYLSIT